MLVCSQIWLLTVCVEDPGICDRSSMPVESAGKLGEACASIACVCRACCRLS